MTWRESVWSWLSASREPLEFAARVVVVLGVPAFFFQQWHEAKIRRVSETLDYAARFQGERLSQRRNELIQPWLEYAEEIQRINEVGVNTSLLDTWVEGIVSARLDRATPVDLRLSVYETTDFLDQLAICIQASLCDHDTADRYFGSFVRSFYCLYGGEVEQLRAGLSIPTFGVPLEETWGRRCQS